MNRRQYRAWTPIAAGFFLFPAEAFAHSLSKRFGDFYGGLLHPLTSMELGLGFLGVALVVGQQGKQGARSTLGWFLGALGLATVTAPWFAGFENQIRLAGLLTTALLGLLAAITLRLRAASLPAVGLLLGLLYGLGNGLAITTQTARHLFACGVLTGGLLAVTPLVAFITTLHRHWQKTAVRVIGSWIAASGLLVIAFHLRGISAALTGG